MKRQQMLYSDFNTTANKDAAGKSGKIQLKTSQNRSVTPNLLGATTGTKINCETYSANEVDSQLTPQTTIEYHQ